MGMNRRSFLSKSIGRSIALGVGCTGTNDVTKSLPESPVWQDDFQINPAINNRKVVCCNDPNMIDITDDASTFARQNASINNERVSQNMDTMVERLTGKTGASQAWATIFRKPETKSWKEVKAAIKVNGFNIRIMPRIAIVGKVCNELINLGMRAENISVYDAGHGATGDRKYTPYIGNGLPAGTVVSDGKQHGTTMVGEERQACTMMVLESDILVNCAVNKGHGQLGLGCFTLTMKNHIGTIKFSCPTITEMVNQNKSAAIIGGSPVRQQLCIVDSLWASETGPNDPPSHVTNRIVMGTLGPLVDVAVARNIREKIMEASHNDWVIASICEDFGYDESDIEWDEFSPG
jgi:hypothetical protein